MIMDLFFFLIVFLYLFSFFTRWFIYQDELFAVFLFLIHCQFNSLFSPQLGLLSIKLNKSLSVSANLS